MSKIRMSIAASAAALMAFTGAVQAQTTATDVDERTTQSEMQRGVPGVDVDTGRRADGAIDIDVGRQDRAGDATRQGTTTERDRGVPGVDVDVGNNARGAVDVNTTRRAPRADRN
jgi:hypothetical protein